MLAMRFARILQDLREDRDISRKDLAMVLNISVSTLGMYEQGRREPNIDMLIKIANYFDVSIDFLVGRSFKNENNKLGVKLPIGSASNTFISSNFLVFVLAKSHISSKKS